MSVKPNIAVTPEALRQIAQNHNLAVCPCCSGEFSEPKIGTHNSATESWQGWSCEKCNVSWVLRLKNSTWERNAFNTYSHTLELTAAWKHACGCGSDHTVVIYRAEPHGRCLGHARLNHLCNLEREGMSSDAYVPGGRSLTAA